MQIGRVGTIYGMGDEVMGPYVWCGSNVHNKRTHTHAYSMMLS